MINIIGNLLLEGAEMAYELGDENVIFSSEELELRYNI